MTARFPRVLGVAALAVGAGLVAIAAALYVTWPDNLLGVYLHERRNREANIHALERQVAQESDPGQRTFYQAWLAEEKGDLEGAIQGFRAARDGAQPGTRLYLRGSLRLGLAYGRNNRPDLELAVYRAMMERYPGPSCLSQAMYHLRHGDREQARRLLDEALAHDAQDGSLGPDRALALSLRAGLGSTEKGTAPSSP